MSAGTTLRWLATVGIACLLIISATANGQETASVAASGPDLHAYYRLPGNIDSWIALAIVLVSVAIAFSLNHEAPAVRTGGTVLAALGCFTVVAWFFIVRSTGIFEEPRTIIPATGQFRPGILWGIAVLAFVSGVFLLRVAAWQSKRAVGDTLPATNTDTRFGRVSRYLHWTTAVLFLTLLPMGFFTSMIPEGIEWRQGYYVVHKTIGFTVFILVLIRLLWNTTSKTPALDGSLKRWERWSAKAAHYFLYFAMIASPITGYAMSTFGGMWSHFFIWDTPKFWEIDMVAIQPWGLMHKVVLPYLCLLVIGAHIIGALKHHFVDKHRDSIHRMVS